MHMIIRTLVFLLAATLLQSCGYKEKEEQLKKREQQIAEKEQMLIQWEQRLTVQEKELQDKKKKMEDSTAVTDSLQAQTIAGKWTVKMRCTETSCSGSAIGDTKTETWEITYAAGRMVVNAFSGNELARIYNGSFLQNKLEVMSGQEGSDSMMRVQIELKENKLEGIRDVERSDCKIRYTLTAERQK
jgi:hypothetical protein